MNLFEALTTGIFTPTKTPAHLVDTIDRMLHELESNSLQVEKKRNYQFNSYNRVVQSENTPWYREFARMFSSSRERKNQHHDTLIKRRNVIIVLKDLLRGQSTSKYAPYIIKLAEKYKDLWAEEAEGLEAIYKKSAEREHQASIFNDDDGVPF